MSLERKLQRALDALADSGLAILSAVYFLAGFLEAGEIAGFWGSFAGISSIAKVWKLYFCFCSLIGGIALWVKGRTAKLVFIFVLLAQLAVFVFWAQELEYQSATLLFYFSTLVVYFVLLTRRLRPVPA